MTKLFHYVTTKKKSDGSIIEIYKPNPEYDIYIKSINIDTGIIEDKKITKYTVHKNLVIYRIESELFETFWAGSDHSLLVFNNELKKIEIIKPGQLIYLKEIEPDKYFFLKLRENYTAPLESSALEQLPEEEKRYIRILTHCQLISVKDIDIFLDFEKEIAYDFTVEDNYTFMLSNGIFVQDTFAVYSLLTLEAQQDAKNLMYKPLPAKKPDEFLWDFKQDILLGLYLLTRNVKDNDFMLKGHKRKHIGEVTKEELYDNYKNYIANDEYHIYDKCTLLMKDKQDPDSNTIVRDITLGQAIVTSIFENKFLQKYFPSNYIDFEITKKSISKITDALNDYYGINDDRLSHLSDDMKNRGFITSTVYPVGLLLNEFLNSKRFNSLKKRYNAAKTLDEKQRISKEIEEYLKKNIAEDLPMLSLLVLSGARGNVNQIRQMFVTKGIIQDATGNLKSIGNNFLDGFNSEAYFYAGYASRKGMMDRALNTATTGYLMRKLIYACSSVVLSKSVKDCKTKRYIKLKLDESNYKLMLFRYFLDRGKIKLLNKENYKDYLGKELNFRTPMFCQSKEICHICAGEFIKSLHTPYIGILAGGTMGERGTQEIMKTFHTGGSVTLEIPDMFKIISNNNPNIDISFLKENFIQKETVLLLKNKNVRHLKLKIYLSNYDGMFTKNDFKSIFNPNQSKLSVISNGKIIVALKYIIADIEVDHKIIKDLIIDIPIDIDLSNVTDYGFDYDEKQEETYFYLQFDVKELSSGKPFLVTEMQSQDLNNIMALLLGLIEKRNKIVRYPEALFYKLLDIYGKFGIYYAYIEILISQLFRSSEDMTVLYRLVQNKPGIKPVLIGIKNVPVYDSWFTGLLFENAQKSIETGLITSEGTDFSNPLERLITKTITGDE